MTGLVLFVAGFLACVALVCLAGMWIIRKIVG